MYPRWDMQMRGVACIMVSRKEWEYVEKILEEHPLSQ